MKFGASNHNNMFFEDDRMSEKVKKVTILIFDVLIIASLVFLAVVAARAQTTETFDITLSADKASYQYKEAITFTLEAENTTGDDLIIPFETGCQMSFEVFQYSNEASGYSMPVYNNELYPRVCSLTPTSITIPDSKKAVWTRTLDFTDSVYPPLLPGDYVVFGYITDHKDEQWSLQKTAFLEFSVDYTEGGVEGGYCESNEDCASTLDCKYQTLFTETGGICMKDPHPFDASGFDELLCLSTGGEYEDTCSCPAGYSWNETVGCSTAGSLAELCVTTGGYIKGPDFDECVCDEFEIWDITNGCTEGERQGFNDIEGHWAEEYIMDLYKRGIVNGYEDGGFHPDRNVSRAELTKMAVASATIAPEMPEDDPEFKFDDLDDWQQKWVYTAWKNGTVEGYDENTFNPNQDITRAEALKVAMESFNVEVPDTSDEWAFPDTMEHWAISYINKAYLDFIVSGREDGKFHPNAPITRAEAAKILDLLSEQYT
jgi:hypothetical protein